jgi:glycerol-3-phosphate cytidylyltransferase
MESAQMAKVLVTGSFDDLRSRHVRFLEEASKHGPLTVLLWSDALVEALTGRPPKFPLKERRYLLDAIRFVHHSVVIDGAAQQQLFSRIQEEQPALFMLLEDDEQSFLEDFCVPIIFRAAPSLLKKSRAFPCRSTLTFQISPTGKRSWLPAVMTGSIQAMSAFLRKSQNWAIFTSSLGTMPMSAISKEKVTPCSLKKSVFTWCRQYAM